MSAPSPQPLNAALPTSLVAGDALFLSVATGLPAGTFVFFTLTLLNASPVRQRIGWDATANAPNVTVDASGVASFAVPSATTAAWVPGKYRWIAFSWDGSHRTQLAKGEIVIEADPNGATPADERTQDERILAQIDALLENKTLDDVAEYEINGRRLTKIPPKELLTLKGVYEARVRNARIRRGEKVATRTVGIVFGGRG